MGVILGGDTAWKVRVKGDIVCAFHWVQGEPAMCLYPRDKRLGAAAFVIKLSVAHQYARSNGYPTKYLMEACGKAAVVMGMEAQGFTMHRIADVILDGLPDLVEMPPEPAFPKKKGQRAGEITLKLGDKEIATNEIELPSSIEIPSMTSH
jgi:hypothetical protein